MEILQNPVIEGILAAIIFISILVEVKTAGFSGGGLVAALFGILLIMNHWYDSAWPVAEALLYFGGLVLIFADLLFLATGAAAVAGLVSVAVSLYLIFGADMTAMYVLVAGVLLAIAGGFAVVRRLPESALWRKITLSTSLTTQKGYVSSAASLKVWEGKSGVARSVLRPAGKVEIEGRVLDAVSEGDFIPAGSAVLVVRGESSYLVVRKKEA